MALKDKAWISTVRDFGKWWALRNDLIVKVTDSNVVTITNPSADAIEGVALQVPIGWKLYDGQNAYQENHTAIIKRIAGHTTQSIRFTTN